MAKPLRQLPWPIVWGFRLASVAMVVAGIWIAWNKFRPNEEQAELTRYVEHEVPAFLERERAVYDRLDRLSNTPGPTAAEARTLLVDDVIPRLIALRKLAESVVAHAPSLQAINAEYLAVVDKLLDACRNSVRTIDDPTVAGSDAHKGVRARFLAAGEASRAWSQHLADTCKKAGLKSP
jgi:hypothetical protein